MSFQTMMRWAFAILMFIISHSKYSYQVFYVWFCLKIVVIWYFGIKKVKTFGNADQIQSPTHNKFWEPTAVGCCVNTFFDMNCNWVLLGHFIFIRSAWLLWRIRRCKKEHPCWRDTISTEKVAMTLNCWAMLRILRFLL